MKKLSILLLCLPLVAMAQTEELRKLPKVELGFQGINLGYELPLGKKWLVEPQIGMGGTVEITNSSISYRMGATASQNYFSPFVGGHLRYYFNRDRRESKGHSLANNAGSYWGFQTKMVYNSNVDSVLVNDFHFGQQLPLGKNFVFRYNAGVGMGFNLAYGYGAIYPIVGASFGYAF